MMTRVKTVAELADQRQSGQMNATILELLGTSLQAGMTTKDLAIIAANELKKLGGKPTFLGYGGFPDVLCVSVNHEIVHGIPNGYVLEEGDIVSFDFGVTYNGMITDAARTKIVGNTASANIRQLVTGTLAALDKGIEVLKDGVRVGTIASAVEKEMQKYGFGIVRDLVGHGVGHELHEDPNIPNYSTGHKGPILHSGMTIAIEPMATLGSYAVYTAADGWTILSKDHSMAAHFEDTILITDNGAEVLTRL